MKGWHFTTSDCRLGYGDGRKIRAGETITVDCEPVLCHAGLHASRRIIDALHYAPGHYIWRVEVGGDIKVSDDKLVGTQRTALWGFDAEFLLRDFARRCALDVIHLWDAPDAVVRYLKTGDKSIRAAARDAAWAAARDAAWAAARDAAWAAARAAARAAAWAAARDAAWAAARDAAMDAAWAAAWDAASAAQNRRLTAMVSSHYARSQK